MPNPSPSSEYSHPLYYVRSSRNPNVFYCVITDPATLTLRCHCPQRQYRNQPCRHEKVVAAGQAQPAMAKGTTVPTPPIGEPLPIGNMPTIGGTGPMGPKGTTVPTPRRMTTNVVTDDLYGDPDTIDRALARMRGAA